MKDCFSKKTINMAPLGILRLLNTHLFMFLRHIAMFQICFTYSIYDENCL